MTRKRLFYPICNFILRRHLIFMFNISKIPTIIVSIILILGLTSQSWARCSYWHDRQYLSTAEIKKLITGKTVTEFRMVKRKGGSRGVFTKRERTKYNKNGTYSARIIKRQNGGYVHTTMMTNWSVSNGRFCRLNGCARVFKTSPKCMYFDFGKVVDIFKVR